MKVYKLLSDSHHAVHDAGGEDQSAAEERAHAQQTQEERRQSETATDIHRLGQ